MASSNQLSQFLGKKVIVGKAQRSGRYWNRGGCQCPPIMNFELTGGRHVSSQGVYGKGLDLDYASGCASVASVLDTLTSLRPYVRDRFATTGVGHADTLHNANPGRTYYTYGSAGLASPMDDGDQYGSLDLTPQSICAHRVVDGAYDSSNGQEPLRGGCALRQCAVTPNKRRQALQQLHRQRGMRQANQKAYSTQAHGEMMPVEGYTENFDMPVIPAPSMRNCFGPQGHPTDFGRGIVDVSAQLAEQLADLTPEQVNAALADPRTPPFVRQALIQTMRSWTNRQQHSRRRVSRDAFATVSGYPGYYGP